MNIVIVIDIYDMLTNGTVMTAYRFAREFRRRGHNVRIVATGAKGEGCFEVPERYIPIVTEVSAKQQIRFGKPDEKILRAAFEGADIIHFYLPFKLERKGRKIAESMGIPCTSAFHLHPQNITYNIGIKHGGLLSSFIYFLFRKKFYRHFEHIHCPSAFIADELKKHGYKQKLHVISNGVEKDFSSVKKTYGDAGEYFEILSVGRYAAEKRQDLIIKAVAASKYSDRIRLTLAGRGPRREKLERMAKKLLKNPVRFAFYGKDELIEVIRASDLYVHAADVEIEGISCIEAFSAGLVPLIADSPKSATPQFAIDDRSLFRAGSVKSLTEKIDYFIEHRDELKDLSKKYIEEGERYSIEYSVDKTEEMFREAIRTQKNRKLLNTAKCRKTRKQFFNRSWFHKALSWIFYYFIATPLLYFYIYPVYGLRVKGRKNLKKAKKTGAISVSNHVHVLDSVMNALALWPRKMIFTSVKSNFHIPVAGKILGVAGVIPVAGSINEAVVFRNELKRILKRKHIVHIYPEGHLINYYSGIRPFGNGAFSLACDSQVPIIPIVIAWRRRRGLYKLFIRSKPCATLYIGAPVFPNRILLSHEQEEDLRIRTKLEMERIFSLSEGPNSVDYLAENGIAPEEFKIRTGMSRKADKVADHTKDESRKCITDSSEEANKDNKYLH